jgi:X-X-X-Leu-X-X-Gly heptad repeat protein
MRISVIVKAVLVAGALAVPLIGEAASTVSTGTGALTANAQVQFQITIPQVLYLRVGTGSSYTTGTLTTVNTVDTINFTPTSSQLTGGAVTATAGSGDLGNGAETAAVIGNGGTVTLGASTPGAMNDGAGDTINWSQITTASTTLSTGTALPAPVLANGASTTLTLNATGKTVYEDAKWTYTYNITAGSPPAAGTYGGATASQNGTVTYTASMP